MRRGNLPPAEAGKVAPEPHSVTRVGAVDASIGASIDASVDAPIGGRGVGGSGSFDSQNERP